MNVKVMSIPPQVVKNMCPNDSWFFKKYKYLPIVTVFHKRSFYDFRDANKSNLGNKEAVFFYIVSVFLN